MPRKAPSAVSWYARAVLGQILGGETKQTFTHADLNDEELQAVRVAINNARGDGRDYISYEDYPTKEKFWTDAESIVGELDMLMSDPARSAMFTLGTAKFDDEGVVYDMYDFGGKKDQKVPLSSVPDAISSPNRRSVFNLIGNAVGLRSGAGRPVRIETGQIAREQRK